jgi:hypothetical protein
MEIFTIVNEVTRVKPENPVAKVIRIGQVLGLPTFSSAARVSSVFLNIP